MNKTRITSATVLALGLLAAGKCAIGASFTFSVRVPGVPNPITPPVIDALSLSVTGLAGGNSITISGKHFKSGDQAYFGDKAAKIQSITSTSIRAINPSVTAPQVVSVRVVDPNGNAGTLGNAFAYTYPYAVQEIAQYGGGAWGTNVQNWTDRSAQWFYVSSGYNNAPGGSSTHYAYVYRNTTGAPIKATVSVAADSGFSMELNGNALMSGTDWQITYSHSVTLQPGVNLFTATLNNGGSSPNPSGLLVSVRSGSGQVLFDTAANWTHP